MTPIKIIYFCLTLLPSVIHGNHEDSPFENILNEIDHMSYINADINGVFIPSPGGYLGEGEFGFVYKGLFKPTNMEVAMKFTPEEEQFEAAKEYAIYTYLNAVNNTVAEAFGISSVHYFGLWDDYVLMAITLLDANGMTLAKNNQINELDMIIIFRDFVRITKYIHGCGVRHEDIKLDNIMYRLHQGFIIDFNSATKMYGRRREKDLNLLATHANVDGAKYAKADWKCFFVTMFDYLCSHAEFFGAGAAKLMNERKYLELESKEDKLNKMKTIGTIKHNGLRKVFIEFAEHIYSNEIQHLSADDDGTPFYDQMYKIIDAEIKRFCPYKLGIVSWLDDNQKMQAMHQMRIHPIPPIDTLKDPFGNKEPKYANVYYDLFYNVYHNPGSGQMFARSESFGQTRRRILGMLQV